MSLVRRAPLYTRLVLSVTALVCSASMAQDPTTPKHFWSVAPQELAVGNSALLHLEICDRRQFQWGPMVLPTNPALLAQFKSEIAIRNATGRQACEGTRWTWTVLPTQPGEIALGDMVVRYSEFGREVSLRLAGPSMRVRGRPKWLPRLIANEAPRIFRWEPAVEESQRDDAFVQRSVLIQSSLSRKEIEQWVALMLASQPAWAELPALIRPVGEGLGDTFLITLYAPKVPPQVPSLTLRLGFYNARTNGIEHRVITVPAQEVQGGSNLDGSNIFISWTRVYAWGVENTPWIASVVMLLLLLHWILRRHVWRLYRLLLLWRIARAGDAQEVWSVLKRSPWPVAAGLDSTPAQWLRLVTQKSGGGESMTGLRTAIDALEMALFSNRFSLRTSDVKLLLKNSIRVLMA